MCKSLNLVTDYSFPQFASFNRLTELGYYLTPVYPLFSHFSPFAVKFVKFCF